MFEQAKQLIEDAKRITVVQAENPDGDSLGSALALEEILSDAGHAVSIYCPVEIPKYMRYIRGWDRVSSDFDIKADLVIIVDTAADVLLQKVLDTPGLRSFLETHPVLVIDHHTTESNLSFSHTMLSDEAVATSHIIYRLAVDAGWEINPMAAEQMLIALMSDSLGLTTPNVTPDSFHFAGELTALGASNSEIENRRREFMKKSPEILAYKAELISRVEYFLEGKLALVHIPWNEIEKYSDQYNPGALILDELRLVEGVEAGIAIKTYPDGKLTARIRCASPVAETIASYFGGGGHAYAAGFRVYESYDAVLPEILNAADKALREINRETL